MKKHLLIAIAVIASLTGALFALAPLQEARQHLEKAHSLLTKKEEGGSGGGKKRKKGKGGDGKIAAALSDAELSLNEAKRTNGTATNVALKFISEAKAELEAAKDGEDEHIDKAQKAIEEALKRVMQIIKH